MSELGTRSLTLTVNSVNFTTQVSKCEITSNAQDNDGFVSFAAAAAGGARDYKLELEFVQDLAAATLWRLMWSSPGMTFPYLVKPYGNATASVSQPHYSGNVTLTEPDGAIIGGEADANVSARMLTECAWTCTGRPTEITA